MSAFLLHCLIAFFAALVFALVLGSWKEVFEAARSEGPTSAKVLPPGQVSLIVPARDAAGTLVPLLQDLHAQRYPKDLLEVLVVDDHDANRLLVTALLTSWRCRFAEAANAEDALVMLQAAARAGDPFQVALLDMQMPDVDGAELGQQIHVT